MSKRPHPSPDDVLRRLVNTPSEKSAQKLKPKKPQKQAEK
jgi:hypothetical protein